MAPRPPLYMLVAGASLGATWVYYSSSILRLYMYSATAKYSSSSVFMYRWKYRRCWVRWPRGVRVGAQALRQRPFSSYTVYVQYWITFTPYSDGRTFLKKYRLQVEVDKMVRKSLHTQKHLVVTIHFINSRAESIAWDSLFKGVEKHGLQMKKTTCQERNQMVINVW